MCIVGKGVIADDEAGTLANSRIKHRLSSLCASFHSRMSNAVRVSLVDFVLQKLDKLICDALYDDDMLRGEAKLSIMQKCSESAQLRRSGKIGIRKNDGRPFPSQLHQNGLEIFCCRLTNNAAHRRTADKVDLLET